MRIKIGVVCMVLGALLIGGALTLFLYNEKEAKQAEETSEQLLVEMVAQMEHAVTETQGQEPELVIPEELLTEEDVTMKETEINGHAYIGYLSIPTLKLELPIMSDWNSRKLQIAPCRYHGTLKGNDLVLMAHNFSRHFGHIAKLSSGDPVFFTDVDGNVTEYAVIAQDILDPYAVEEMIAGNYDLTMFTCTYGGKNRVTVYCDKAE